MINKKIIGRQSCKSVFFGWGAKKYKRKFGIR